MTTTEFIFISQNDPSDDILVVSEKAIESVAIADTYDHYGQKVGHIDAGDYLTIETQEAADAANEIYNNNRQEWDDETPPIEKFQVGDAVSAYDYSDVFDALIDHDGVTLEQEEIQAIQYWDGHNFRTFALEGDGQDGEIIDDDDLIEKLESALDEMEYSHETTGCKYWETENFVICESAWQGAFERYSISRK